MSVSLRSSYGFFFFFVQFCLRFSNQIQKEDYPSWTLQFVWDNVTSYDNNIIITEITDRLFLVSVHGLAISHKDHCYDDIYGTRTAVRRVHVVNIQFVRPERMYRTACTHTHIQGKLLMYQIIVETQKGRRKWK